jgi:UDPglucose 6-dehydrogenase
MTRICVIGTGYVGLVGAAVFSDWGNAVVGVDLDRAKLAKIMAGEMPIYEPGLSELVANGLANGKLKFTHLLEEGIEDAEVIMICVGTPQGESGDADVSSVLQVANQIGQKLDHYAVVVTKSTVPVGTNLQVKKILQETVKAGVGFDVVSCPEFLAQGTSVKDMQNTARTVIGSDSPGALDIVAHIFEHLPGPIIRCGFAEAELIKYAANSLLATKISFADSIAALCELVGADVTLVMKAVGLDPRIGPNFLKAGLGWGGSCFPKDVQALARFAAKIALPLPQLQGTLDTNRRVHKRFVSKISKHFDDKLDGKTFAVLGLAFKAGTDDVRESPAVKVIMRLRGAGATVRVYDPEATEKARYALGDTSVVYCKEPFETMEGADALVMLTDWPEFAAIDLARVMSMLKNPVIFDGRNQLDIAKVEGMGFTYYGMGRPSKGESELRKKDITYIAALNNVNGGAPASK